MKRSTELFRAVISAGLVLGTLATQTPAQADTRPENKKLVASVRVSYSDLDPNDPADAEILLGRIRKAAYRACGGDPRLHPGYDLMPGRVEAVYRDCREEAFARAISEIPAPSLAHVATSASLETPRLQAITCDVASEQAQAPAKSKVRSGHPRFRTSRPPRAREATAERFACDPKAPHEVVADRAGKSASDSRT